MSEKIDNSFEKFWGKYEQFKKDFIQKVSQNYIKFWLKVSSKNSIHKAI